MSDEPTTFEVAIQNAARLLRHAEMEIDPVKMERFEKLADSWLGMANLVTEKEKV